MKFRWCLFLVCLLSAGHLQAASESLYLQHLSDSVGLGRRFLQANQLPDGMYPADGFLVHPVAVTAASTYALLRTGTSPDQPEFRLSLSALRKLPHEDLQRVNELSLVILVLAAVNDQEDSHRLSQLTRQLEQAQLPSGSWPHRIGELTGNLSDSEFALLAVQESEAVGNTISPDVWKRGQAFWLGTQLSNGGWPEFFQEADRATQPAISSISGTLAGVAMLGMCESQLRSLNERSSANCCQEGGESEALRRGKQWLTEHCHRKQSTTAIDHLYGIERTVRRQGELFPGEEQWFRQAAITLLERQHHSRGYWPGNNAAISTSYALLSLMSGATPSIINSISGQTSRQAHVETRHPHAVWNLSDAFQRSKTSARLLHPHEVDLAAIAATTGVEDVLLEAPVLFLTGEQAPDFSAEEIALLKQYLDGGGLLLAATSCDSADFDSGFRELVRRLASPLDGELTRLPDHHPVYRSHFSLNAQEAEIWELNSGCRTSILYVPQDLACHWEHKSGAATPDSADEMSLKIGMNVMAWVAGTELPRARQRQDFVPGQLQDTGRDRGFLQLAVVNKQGSGSSVPTAARHLIKATNHALGDILAAEPVTVGLTDPRLSHSPLLYWHGDRPFTLSDFEQAALRTHLNRGAVLLADACCRSQGFDASFRKAMQQLYPDASLRPIPLQHELLTDAMAFDLREVGVQLYAADPASGLMRLTEQRQRPKLEAIEQSGRYVVIYSPLDLSCAMGATGRPECEGYLPADALRIGTNLIVYSLLQDLKEIPREDFPSR